jgi:hypothetical protein
LIAFAYARSLCLYVPFDCQCYWPLDGESAILRIAKWLGKVQQPQAAKTKWGGGDRSLPEINSLNLSKKLLVVGWELVKNSIIIECFRSWIYPKFGIGG